jgi:hypothetical protein
MRAWSCVIAEQLSRREKTKAFGNYCGIRDCRLGSIRDMPGITVQSVLRLVLDGTLHIDWWRPLSWDSVVSTVPIGYQLFPSHPIPPA